MTENDEKTGLPMQHFDYMEGTSDQQVAATQRAQQEAAALKTQQELAKLNPVAFTPEQPAEPATPATAPENETP